MRRQHLAPDHAAVVAHAGKLADGKAPIIVLHRALGAHAAQRGSLPAQEAQIGRALLAQFHRAACAEQVLQFEQGRNRAHALLGGAQKNARLIAQAQRAYATDIIDAQQIVKLRQRGGERPARTSLALPPPGMVARDDAAPPAIGRRVRQREVKDGIDLRRRLAILPFGYQRQIGRERESVRRRQPGGIVGKRRRLARPLAEVAQLTHHARRLSQANGQFAWRRRRHSAPDAEVVLRARMRLGSC